MRRASADKWDFDVAVVRVGDQIYRFLTAAPRGSDRLEPVAAALRQSFRRLTPAEIASLKPLRVRVITVGPGDTVASVSQKMMGTDRPEKLFRILNGLTDGRRIYSGEKVKIIAQ